MMVMARKEFAPRLQGAGHLLKPIREGHHGIGGMGSGTHLLRMLFQRRSAYRHHRSVQSAARP